MKAILAMSSLLRKVLLQNLRCEILAAARRGAHSAPQSRGLSPPTQTSREPRSRRRHPTETGAFVFQGQISSGDAEVEERHVAPVAAVEHLDSPEIAVVGDVGVSRRDL